MKNKLFFLFDIQNSLNDYDKLPQFAEDIKEMIKKEQE